MTGLSVTEISKSYRDPKGNYFKAVNEVSFNIKPGEIFGLLGRNGAGKTSIIRIISGLTIPDSGSVSIFSQSINQNLVGTILEGNRNLYWRLTGLENLIYYGVLKGMSIREAKKRALHLLDQFEFKDFGKRLVQNMSRGMQQKLAIQVALMNNPKLLILDEPTLGLDIVARDNFSTIVKTIARDVDTCVLVTSHDLEFVGRTVSSYCVIDKGVIINAGKTDELKSIQNRAGYRVRVEGELCAVASEKLKAYVGKITWEHDNSFVVATDILYSFLEIIKPLNIHHVVPLADDFEALLYRTNTEGLK